MEFKDSKLATRYGRFCSACKGWASLSALGFSSPRPPSVERKATNRFASFIEAPEKYATGTESSRKKVQELIEALPGLTEAQVVDFRRAHDVYVTKLSKTPSIPKTVSLGETFELLGRAMKGHLSMNIRYKGLGRDINAYASNGTYCIAYCSLRQELRTFRIDKMSHIRLGEPFSFNESLRIQAEEKIKTAHLYSHFRRN